MRNLTRISIALAVTAALAGCSARARYERSVLPDGLSGLPPAVDPERVRLTKEYL